MSKHKINEKFFNIWKPEMAYILGYLYADGCLSDCKDIRAKYISITSIDKDRIYLFKRLMGSKHKIVILPPITSARKIRYILRIGSHKLFNRLNKLGLYPNKTFTMIFPKIPKPVIHHFIRGYFDGDGCIYLEKSQDKNGRLMYKRLLVAITSGSKDFLNGLGKVLTKVTDTKFRIYKSHRSYQLRYGTNDTVKLFEFMYNNVQGRLFTRRKYNKFKEYLSVRPDRLSNKIVEIMKRHG
ncbi:MAG: LAGLIDADG family homing endonuclease [Candidatus Paceibacterota bacterium]